MAPGEDATVGTTAVAIGLTPEQREQRKKGIGASEVAAVLGFDKYKSALDVWLEKTGRAPEETEPPSQAAKMGHLMEPVIHILAQGLYGPHVQLMETGTLVGREPWMLATPDRYCRDWKTMDPGLDGRTPVSGRESFWVADFKTKNWRTFADFGEPGTDQVPEQIGCQLQWQMDVADVDRGDVLVLVDGREFHQYTIPRSRELADALVNEVGAWWLTHVVGDTEPPLTRATDAKWLMQKFGTPTADLLPSTPLTETAVQALASAREILKDWEETEALAKLAVQEILGAHKGVHTRAGKVSWNTVKGRVTTDWKALAEYLAQKLLLEDKLDALTYAQWVASYTTTGQPTRQFRFTPSATKE